MSTVWDEIARYRLPVVYLHQHSGQPPTCLEGLVQYSVQIARNKHTYGFRSPMQIMAWLWTQKVVLDVGDGPKAVGCFPAQRSRVWQDNGLNCWEAVAHLLGVAFCNQWPIEFHVYDAVVGTQRHVFPAVRPLFTNDVIPEPLVIQPPLLRSRSEKSLRLTAAQAWYNDLLGAVHIVGDKVLRVYGVGELADTLADVEGDELPDWARTAKQKEKRAAEKIKKVTDTSTKKAVQATNQNDVAGNKPGKEDSGVAKVDFAKLLGQVEKLAASDKASNDRQSQSDKGE